MIGFASSLFLMAGLMYLVERTGTEVMLAGFDRQWVDDSFDAVAIAR